jgi:hypothetical protein
MADEPRVVRSYQRLFSPDRRIYAVDGRTLPIPGGIPLAWLLAATAALICIVLVTAVSPIVIVLIAGAVASVPARLGRRREATVVFAGAAVAPVAVGSALSEVDWPLRLVVLPAVAATLLTQMTPDGRPAHRFATGWLHARLAGRRRAGAALPTPARPAVVEGRLRVAADAHRPGLVGAQITGPLVIHAREPVIVRRRRRGRRVVVPVSDRRGGVVLDRIELADGERLEVRP